MNPEPQTQTAPPLVTARLWEKPPATATAPCTPGTCNGTTENAPLAPSDPSWPDPLLPQAHTDPSPRTARLWNVPVPSATTSGRVAIATGERMNRPASIPVWPQNVLELHSPKPPPSLPPQP